MVKKNEKNNQKKAYVKTRKNEGWIFQEICNRLLLKFLKFFLNGLTIKTTNTNTNQENMKMNQSKMKIENAKDEYYRKSASGYYLNY